MLRALGIFAGTIALAACATDGGAGSAGVGAGAGAPQKPAYLLADIAGKEAVELDALLGAPDLTRREGDGEFRRYSLASCTLLVVLYPDEKGAKRAASIDAGALKSGDDKPDLDLCLARGRQGAS